jgi:2-C-methyl-D-erythritol 4-phosphate cytidylyltransferase/2-C-methyl-D-erythritol 2,4-cyclodiphosphate synthase
VSDLRIGQGFDVHRFVSNRPLVLCGIEFPGVPGLAGHSDADVALHAVCDALYGSVAAGDIGEHFPDGDSRWSETDSSIFVRHALETVIQAGFRPVNCDLTLVGERPRLAPRRGELRRGLAELLGLDAAAVSVKATTTEGLGFAGRGEGLAAAAVVLVEEVRRDE